MSRRRPAEPIAHPIRGVALVVVAVLAGFLLLRHGIDATEVVRAEDAAAQAAADREREDPDGQAPGEAEDAEPTPPPVRPPAEVSVIVLNGARVAGAAGRYTTALAERGYQVLEAANATGAFVRVQTTQIFHSPGFEMEAAALAQSLGAPPPVGPVPTPPPGEVGTAQVVVVLGVDLASADPPPPAEPAGAQDRPAEPAGAQGGAG